jgi:hypothetical protein
MTAPKEDADRIGDLEDSLMAAEMRVTEMRAERDEAHELVARMREHLEGGPGRHGAMESSIRHDARR